MATTDITIHASIPMPFNFGGGNPPVTNAETFDGTIPRAPILLDVGDTLIVRLINDLPTGIRCHGIELENYSAGTKVTQNEVRPWALKIWPMRSGKDFRSRPLKSDKPITSW